MKYFLSFGDDKYKNSKIRIEQEARNSGFFDYINIYGPEHLSEEFKEKTKPYINAQRGAGLWLFKPFIIKKTFEHMNYGDYCVYADAGCLINPNGIDRFEQYLKMIEETGVLSFRMDGLDEEQYTTEKIFKTLGVIDEHPEVRKSGQIMATIIILRKNSNSVKLINDFYNLAINFTSLFSDEHNSGNCSRFIADRNDQSILSVLRKTQGSTEIIDETWAPDMEGWNKKLYIDKIPFLATRIRQ